MKLRGVNDFDAERRKFNMTVDWIIKNLEKYVNNFLNISNLISDFNFRNIILKIIMHLNPIFFIFSLNHYTLIVGFLVHLK